MISQIKKVALHEIIYEELKKSILEGEFRPGERLNQSDLSEKLGVSRMPVRDALRILENDALVENQLDKGYVVANFSKIMMEDTLFVRRILEPKAVLLSKEYMTDDDIALLEDNLAKACTELEMQNLKNLRSLNTEFHFTIYKKVPSPLLHDLINKLWHSFPKYILHEQYESNQHSLQGHKRILNFIKEGNFVAAADEMEKHIIRIT